MHQIMEAFQQQILVSDGAMGTMLQARGLAAGGSPEVLMLEDPQRILDIQTAYAKAGARIIETNTFGANRLKLAEFGCQDKVREINALAVGLAREAAGSQSFVAGIVGPTGQFPRPIGSVPFLELKEVFAEQIQALSLAGVDMIYLQTFSDLGEARAAYLAARDVTTLPVAVSLTYDAKLRTLTGTDPQTCATVFSALGADMLGVNCGFGPQEMLPVLDSYRKTCSLPLLAEPNAGLPVLLEGKSVFPMSPEEMADYVPMMLELGVRCIGSCCGSTPEHTRAIARKVETSLENLKILEPARPVPALASRSRTLFLGSGCPPRLIGERINPTARKALASALQSGNYSRLIQEGVAQIHAGADLLDVNTGMAGGDEAEHLLRTSYRLQQMLDCPLVLDSVDPLALEKALIHFQGKALINSVNGESGSLDKILPLAKQYGAAVLGLTLDSRGIPDKAEDRLAIARRILDRALAEGIPREDVYIDCLVLSCATDPALARETLKGIRLVKEELGLVTVLGLSNISHGLPKRPWLNHAFLAQALAAGLDAVIANPLDAGIRQTLAAGALLSGRDPHGLRYIQRTKQEDTLAAEEAAQSLTQPKAEVPPQQVVASMEESLPGGGGAGADGIPADTPPALKVQLLELQQSILSGNEEVIPEELEKLLDSRSFLELVAQAIIPALELAGDSFAKGETFLPQLLLAADGARCAFDYLKKALPSEAPQKRETVVLGAVAGDVHDIGKNIVRALLESYGYQIVDLGKNVPAQAFVDAVKKHHAQVLGLSALMTTTMTEMAPIIRQIRQEHLPVSVIVGGAVLTRDYAETIGADAYVKDAAEAHTIIRQLLD